MTPGKRLGDILEGIEFSSDREVGGARVLALTADSRRVEKGSLFICLRGLVADGHDFAQTAASQGAVAIVANRARQGTLPLDPELPVIWVEDTRRVIGEIAAAFYGQPAQGLTLIGLTGTNGKTTTSFILEAMIRAAGGSPGVIGTINYRYAGREYPARFTTPEPIELQRLLREMVGHGVTHVVMEVSSHALALYRIQGLEFDVALFTNLTRDHLDFHQEMESYYQAKKRLFTDYLRDQGTAVILVEREDSGPDSGWGARLLREIKGLLGAGGGRAIGCGPGQEVSALDPLFGLEGTSATIEAPGVRLPIATNLVGAYNLKNLLGAVGVGLALNLTPRAIEQGLAVPIKVPGRLEQVTVGEGQGLPFVFVDYAHTPDALANVLSTLRELGPERLLVVFGCGGDRDPGKRRLMGEIAGRQAEVAIITADNSRSESTSRIMAEIERGVVAAGMSPLGGPARTERGYAAVSARGEAIAMAIDLAGGRDIVLISGKGHETYQISAGGSAFFDDRLEAARCLQAKSGATGGGDDGHGAA